MGTFWHLKKDKINKIPESALQILLVNPTVFEPFVKNLSVL